MQQTKKKPLQSLTQIICIEKKKKKQKTSQNCILKILINNPTNSPRSQRQPATPLLNVTAQVALR